MEPLHRLFQKAQQDGLLHRLSPGGDNFRASLYADDAAVFIRPTEQDLRVTSMLLQLFGDASGLITNLSKTEFYPIQCDMTSLDFITANNYTLSAFPGTYLGLPLNIRKPSRATIQPLLQKIVNRLPGWKRRFFTYPGRELPVKTVLMAMPTYFLTVFKLPKWAIKAIDKYRRGFFWKGQDHDNVRGGHCLVNWQTCLRPKHLCGLGIKDLEKFGRVLRLGWLWYKWDNRERPWQRLLKVNDPLDRELFFCSTNITVGNGKKTPFWEARWLNGTSPKDLAPNLYLQAKFKRRKVCQELHNDNWIRNLQNIETPVLLQEFVLLFMALVDINLSEQPDAIIWRWTEHGRYTVRSAYEIQFAGATVYFPTT